jgi:cyclic pyranopterin phosphate synthase
MLARVGVADLALTTNGQHLAIRARPLRKAGVERVNISLDSLDPERYSRLTRGGRLDRTLTGIAAARAAGFRLIKINTVVLRGENDSEVCHLVRFAGAAGLEIRFLELMAIGIAADCQPAWFVSSDEVRERLEAEFRLIAVKSPYEERTRIYLAEDSAGRATRVGFISPVTQPFCASCRRLRLTSDGRLLGCLMHSTGPDLLPLLRGGEPDYAALDHAVRAALGAKPARRNASSPRLMAGIGG